MSVYDVTEDEGGRSKMKDRSRTKTLSSITFNANNNNNNNNQPTSNQDGNNNTSNNNNNNSNVVAVVDENTTEGVLQMEMNGWFYNYYVSRYE